MVCKYCGDSVNGSGYCVRCGAKFSVSSGKGSSYSGGGNARPNSNLWQASEDIKEIGRRSHEEAVARRQAVNAEFARRRQEIDARTAAKIAEKNARKAQKANKNTNNNINTSSNEKSGSGIGIKLGGGLILGLLACLISPNLFIVGFIVGFIITKTK